MGFPKSQVELMPAEIFIPPFSVKVWVCFAHFSLNKLLQCGRGETVIEFYVTTTLDENEA